jgi:vacuolar protein sorting-associated protein 54
MDDRLKSHARNFDKLDWEKIPQGKPAHAYAETVVSETSTLHNVLKRYLSPMVIEVLPHCV